MSSFPRHIENIKALEDLGFDVSDCLDEDGKVTLDSWGYDELTYLLSEVIEVLQQTGYKEKIKNKETNNDQ